MSTTHAIPPDHAGLMPYLVVHDAARAIEFYRNLFGAVEVSRMNQPGSDRVMHAELVIRDAVFMLSDEFPEQGYRSPLAYGGLPPVSIMLYVQDVDALFAKAQELGAKVIMPPTDMFWGDRFCKLADPFGHLWAVSTHLRDVPPEEMAAAAANFCPEP